MVDLKEIIEKQNIDIENRQNQEQLKLYRERALLELKEKGYYTVAPLGNEDLTGPVGISMHYTKNSQSPLGKNYFHNHDLFEIVYVYRGKCINRFQQYSTTLSQGDVMILNPTTLHGLYTEDTNEVIFNLLIPKKVFHDVFTSLMSDNCVSNFVINYMYQINTVSDFIIVNYQKDSPLNDLLNQIIWEYFHKKQDFYFIMRKMLELCFAYMSRDYWMQDCFTNQVPDTMQLSSIITYIYKNYNTVTLKETSLLFGYHEKYLSRLIRKKFGMSYQTMIKKIRMTHASQLLIKTDMSVDEVANTVGYTNVTNFYKFFQEEYKKTPAEYRKQLSDK